MPDISYKMDSLRFVWDDDKNRINISEHGLRLEQLDERHSTMEKTRYITKDCQFALKKMIKWLTP